MAQLAGQRDEASPSALLLRDGGERSPLTPSLGGLDHYSPMSVLMGSLMAVETHKQVETEAAALEAVTSSPTTPSGAHFPAAGDGPRQCPPTPLRPLRLERQDSLNNTKLLCATAQLGRVSQTSYPVLASGSQPPSEGQAGHFPGNQAFDFIRVIGHSPTSEVWLVRSKNNGLLSAVKRSLAEFKSRADRDRYLQEVKAAASLPEHPHVVRYFRAWQQERHFYVQQELCEGGSLAAVLRSLPPGVQLPETDIWRLAAEIADGLAHCHAHGVLHLDVKPGNIFLDAKATAKLGDFGNAYLCGKGWSLEEGDGAYVAPEMLRFDGSAASPAADIFSFGASLFEAATGSPPLPGSTAEQCVMPGRSETLHHMLHAMLATKPEARPSAFEVFQYASAARRVRCI